MSKSEVLFKQYLLRTYPSAYVRKFPDLKQTGSSLLRGMPDYLVITNGEHTWFEVKYTTSYKTFNLLEINQYQWIEFNKLLQCGVDVIVVIYDGRFVPHFELFSTLLSARQNGKKSFSL